MGSDIHLIVEARTGVESRWEQVEITYPCPSCGSSGKSEHNADKKCWNCNGSGKASGYDDRSYDTFAILANVRNGYGFAGVPTGRGFVPISEPRGLPQDSTFEEERDEYGDLVHWLGDHSRSWLTLAELLAYNWTQQTTEKQGVVPISEYAKWKAEGGGWPKGGWSGGITGPMIFMVSNALADALVAEDIEGQITAKVEFAQQCHWPKLARREEYPRFYTTITWGTTYSEAAGGFYRYFLPALKQYADAHGLDYSQVRIVFGFDS